MAHPMEMTRRQFLVGLAAGAFSGGICLAHAGSGGSPVSRLKGQLIFHRYSSYDAGDSRLYLYDFAQGALTRLGDDWQIANAMNAEFSPDGSAIVFMGQPRGIEAWRIYLWRINSHSPPVDLTAGARGRSEDPKFAPDGTKIVFKQDRRVKTMDLSGKVLSELPSGNGEEQSMPYILPDGKHIVYAQGDGADMKIVCCALDGSGARVLSPPGDQSYYPIPWGSGRLLFTRWESPNNHNDQIYCANLQADQLTRMAFDRADQNNSDPFPADDRFIFFSATGADSMGGYDLYLGDSVTGQTWSLSSLGLNSPLDELGACYSPLEPLGR